VNLRAHAEGRGARRSILVSPKMPLDPVLPNGEGHESKGHIEGEKRGHTKDVGRSPVPARGALRRGAIDGGASALSAGSMAVLSPIPRVLTALSYGALTHAAFALGVGSMVLCMGFGMQLGLGTLTGIWAWLANLLLLLQFPLAHSFLLSAPGRDWLAKLSPAPGRDGKTLATTTYALIASLQLALLFWAWSPTGHIWWQASSTALWAMLALYGAAWGLLGLAILNSGIMLQSGALGWWALLLDRAPVFPELPTRFLYALTRHPIYLAFTCTLWTVPTWSPDQLMVALAWTLYCVLAPRLKERRLEAIHGARYRRYRERVPYFLPQWPRPKVNPPSKGRHHAKRQQTQ